MDLKTALRLDGIGSLALVGSGGKTTNLFRLARELDPPVIVSASTHLAVHQTLWADKHHIIDTPKEIDMILEDPVPDVILVTGAIDGDRTMGLDETILSSISETCQKRSIPLLIEADGSRGCPLKAPADYEPPIPAFVDMVVVLAGLSGVGKNLGSPWVHRPERFSAITGVPLGGSISPTTIVRALTHPEGGLKNIPTGTKRVILLNQADTPEIQTLASKMAQSLLREVQAVIVASLNPQIQYRPPDLTPGLAPYLAVHEPAAGIILAAGDASRYGDVKQLLDWGGKPLVWHAANKAIQAGFSPVIIVCGKAMKDIRIALDDLPVQIVHNPDWAKGQGTSVRAGVQALPPSSGCCVFMLADQPQIPVGLLEKLVKKHSLTRGLIIAPWVAGRRANPVLFDRDFFSVLSGLSGEKGGSSFFGQHEVIFVPWDDPEILLDVDRIEDYQRLVALDPWSV